MRIDAHHKDSLGMEKSESQCIRFDEEVLMFFQRLFETRRFETRPAG
jgi:hypothetical protein